MILCGRHIWYNPKKERDISELENGLKHTNNEETLSAELSGIKSGLVKHSNSKSSYTKKESKHCWIWGKIKGHYTEDGNGYKQRNGESSNILLDFYENNTVPELDKLNGEFFAVIFDEKESNVKLITDRLGSRAAFYTADGHGITFSNDLQSLCRYTGKTELVDRYCIEFLNYKRVFGTKTPFKDVEKLPPATVTTFDLETGNLEHETYWKPEYTPEDKPYSYFVDKFTEIFQQVIEEEIDEDKSYGLMLSGGSDSRLIAGAIDQEITCYHANEWMNYEAQIAEQIAETAGHSFEFLERDENYQSRALKENIELSKFISKFNQAHFYGFHDKLVEEDDILIHGMFADTFFKGHFMDRKSVNLGIGELVIPFEDEKENINNYIENWSSKAYLEPNRAQKTLELEIDNGEELTYHDVSYADLRTLILSDEYFPLTNQPDFLCHDSLLSTSTTIAPFLDIRLIDLHLKISKKIQLRKNIINSTVKQISPNLAEVPNSASKLPQKHPELIHFASNKIQEIANKYLPLKKRETPRPHYSNGSWTDHEEILREKEFAFNSIQDNRELIEDLSFLDYNSCKDLVEEHQQGENKTNEIYHIITFLETLDKIKN